MATLVNCHRKGDPVHIAGQTAAGLLAAYPRYHQGGGCMGAGGAGGTGGAGRAEGTVGPGGTGGAGGP